MGCDDSSSCSHKASSFSSCFINEIEIWKKKKKYEITQNMQLKHSISLPGFLRANFRAISKFLLAQNNQGKKVSICSLTFYSSFFCQGNKVLLMERTCTAPIEKRGRAWMFISIWHIQLSLNCRMAWSNLFCFPVPSHPVSFFLQLIPQVKALLSSALRSPPQAVLKWSLL